MMLIRKFALGVIVIAIAGLVSGCSKGEEENQPISPTFISPESESTPTAAASATLPSDQSIFTEQSNILSEKNPSATVVMNRSDAGSGDLKVPALPDGKTRLGLLINCSGGAWSVVVDQDTPANSGAPCSLTITPSADFPLDSPSSETIVKLVVPHSTKYWVTIFYK